MNAKIELMGRICELISEQKAEIETSFAEYRITREAARERSNLRAVPKNTEKSSAIRKSQDCVVVLDGHQPARVLCLVLQSPSSLPFSYYFWELL